MNVFFIRIIRACRFLWSLLDSLLWLLLLAPSLLLDLSMKLNMDTADDDRTELKLGLLMLNDEDCWWWIRLHLSGNDMDGDSEFLAEGE